MELFDIENKLKNGEIIENIIPNDELCLIAAENGCLNVLKWL